MNRGVILACLVASLGCATETTIRTMPPGAKVTINNQLVGISPVEYSVRKYDWPADNRFRYHIEREGCAPKDGEFSGHVSAGAIVRSVLLWAGLSLIWDNTMVFPDDEMFFQLEPANTVTNNPSGLPTEERLRRADDLYESGLINEQEHRRVRSEILDSQ